MHWVNTKSHTHIRNTVWKKVIKLTLDMTDREEVAIEEFLEGPDKEEEPLELLKLSELTQLSQREIDFHQYIKKLLEESVDVISQIIKDQ